MNLFYGWYIVIASAVIMGYNSFLYIYGFTSFINPIIATFGWSYSQIALAMTVRSMTTGILNPFIGALTDRWPVRRLLIIGGIIMGMGYFVLSRISGLALFYTAYIIIGLGGALAVQLVPLTTIARWFRKNLGKANGITGFSVALGGVAVPLLVTAIDSYGWQDTFLFAAIGTWMLIIPLSFLFKNKPEEFGLNPDGTPPDEFNEPRSLSIETSGLSVRESVKTRSFWLIGFGLMVQGGGSITILAHLMPHLIDAGMEKQQASMVVMAVAIVGLVARLPVGWLMDVISRRNLIGLSIGLSSISFLLLWNIKADSNFVLILAFAVPFGIGNGSLWVRSALIRDYFGTRNFGTVYGILMSFVTIGAGLLPPLTGWVFDEYGHYWPAFAALAALNFAGACLTFWIPRSSASYQ
ncbi:MAG: MFS transporter [Dehalococcoidales bacterium]|nr:MAG: MFS transporter [Dehalococcoidales bacterium]